MSMALHMGHMAWNIAMAVVSLLANGLLIVLVIRVKSASIGSYSILVCVFAVADIIISVTNAIVVPNIHMGRYNFVVFGLGTYSWSAFPGLVSIYVFDMLFYQTFILLSFHFVYRYIVLLSPNHVLQQISMGGWIAIAIGAEIVFNALMVFFITHYEPQMDRRPDPELILHMKEYYDVDMTQSFGHFHVVYAEVLPNGDFDWNFTIVIYTCSILAVISSIGGVMIYCAYSIVRLMRNLAGSHRRKNTHRQLFKALVLQTIVPLIFSFTPVSILVLLPLSGYEFGALGNYMMVLTSIFPAFDPILLIACISSYRRKIYEWLRCAVFLSPPKTRTSSVPTGASMAHLSFSNDTIVRLADREKLVFLHSLNTYKQPGLER